ncbi:unnamed protein product [Meloidogyne enterolobii]|uniref:Uncharacterized protein n=1 Tax=Meloidogyne enterolobii TaxID=390850 RepID=A0ACB1AEM5_MELEN
MFVLNSDFFVVVFSGIVRWKDSDDTIKKEEKIASTFSSSIFANKIPEHLNNSFKQIYSSTSNNSVPINNHIIQPSTSTNVASCSTEAMENLADLALAQLAEFPLIPSSSTSVSSSILMPPPPLPPPPPINITSINTSTISTQIYGISNNLKSTITTKNELFQQPNNNNKFNSQHKKDVKNDSDSIDEKIVKILKEQLGAEGTSFVVNACARVRPFVFERDIQKQKQQQYGKAENKSNFHYSNLLLSRNCNNKSIIDKTTTNNSLTTKYISPSSSNCVDVIVDVVDDSHLYNETKNKDNLDDYIQIENDDNFIKNNCKQGKELNGFVAADGGSGSGEKEMKMDVSSVVQPLPPTTTTTTSAPTLFSTKIIQNIPVLIEEEASGLDFLASTASLLQPIEMNKSNSENNKGNLFNEQNMSNNNKQRHSTFTK